jgi:hypothetical protein
MRLFATVSAAILVLCPLAVASQDPVQNSAPPQGVAQTPPMGWNS